MAAASPAAQTRVPSSRSTVATACDQLRRPAARQEGVRARWSPPRRGRTTAGAAAGSAISNEHRDADLGGQGGEQRRDRRERGLVPGDEERRGRAVRHVATARPRDGDGLSDLDGARPPRQRPAPVTDDLHRHRRSGARLGGIDGQRRQRPDGRAGAVVVEVLVARPGRELELVRAGPREEEAQAGPGLELRPRGQAGSGQHDPHQAGVAVLDDDHVHRHEGRRWPPDAPRGHGRVAGVRVGAVGHGRTVPNTSALVVIATVRP